MASPAGRQQRLVHDGDGIYAVRTPPAREQVKHSAVQHEDDARHAHPANHQRIEASQSRQNSPQQTAADDGILSAEERSHFRATHILGYRLKSGSFPKSDFPLSIWSSALSSSSSAGLSVRGKGIRGSFGEPF